MRTTLAILALTWIFAVQGLAWEAPPLPQSVSLPIENSLENTLTSFLRIPYRTDGAVSDDGRWTTWMNSENTLKSPGFNCSGFVLEAVRFILNRNISLAEASFDRDSDSGPDSPLGLDWDFGLDLLLNLSKVKTEDLLPRPEGEKLTKNQADLPLGWGLDIHGPDFEGFLKELKAPNIYLFAISKPDRRFKAGLSYYHVGILHADQQGALWLYQSTAKAGVHRLNIATPEGLRLIRRYFPPVKGTERRMIAARLETDPDTWSPPLDPWTAAGRLDPLAVPVEAQGDGLGGEIESTNYTPPKDSPNPAKEEPQTASESSKDESIDKITPQNYEINSVEQDGDIKVFNINP
jgi:hypothetical protein